MTNSVRVLVFGKSGQVAQSLAEVGDAGSAAVLAFGRDEINLAAPQDALPAAIAERIAAFEPTFAINAAAYTAVDKAESEEAAANALNREGAAWAATIAHDLGIGFAHISTDYVYDGTKSEPYVETDSVAPQSAYGRSKLAGEEAVLAAHPSALIFRTAWVYSPFGGNFVKTMLRLSAEKESLRVVDDQIGSPTSALDIASGLLQVAASERPAGGIYHLAGSGETTWCGFARDIFRQSAERGGPSIPVDAITTADYPTPATRPANSRLDTTKLERDFGVKLPNWQDSLGDVLDRLLSSKG